MASRKFVSLVLVLGIAVNASGYTFDDVLVEYWAGTGGNEAVVVVDFGIDSYAFGYRWESETKYGRDMMDAVAGGSLDYTETGGFLNMISYDGYLDVGEDKWPTDWWSYFISTDGESWADPGVGFAERELSHGVWDGWAHQTIGDWPPAHLPSSPVPEPTTVALLGLGALVLNRRRA